MVTAAMKLKDTPWKKSYDQHRQHIKKQKYYFADKGPYSQSYGFSSTLVCESWTVKKAECQRIDAFESIQVLEKTLESLLDSKETKKVNLKGNQP